MEEMWFIDSKYNMLVGLDAARKNILCINTIPELLWNKVYEYGIKLNNKIYFYSEYLNAMVIFDFYNSDFEVVASEGKKSIGVNRIAVSMDGNIYLFPLKKDENVISYNVDNNGWNIVDDHKLSKCIMAVEKFDDNRVLIADGNECRVIVFNPKENTSFFLKVQGYKEGLRDVCFDDRYIYGLSLFGAKIFIFDRYNFEFIKSIDLNTDNIKMFQCIIDCGEYLLLLKREARESLKVDKNTMKFNELSGDILNEVFQDTIKVGKNLLWLRKNRCSGGTINIFDISQMKGEEVPYYCDRFMQIAISNKKIVEENRLFTLENFCKIC